MELNFRSSLVGDEAKAEKLPQRHRGTEKRQKPKPQINADQRRREGSGPENRELRTQNRELRSQKLNFGIKSLPSMKLLA